MSNMQISIRVAGGIATLRVGSSRIAETLIQDGKPPGWMTDSADALRKNPPQSAAEAKRVVRGFRLGVT